MFNLNESNCIDNTFINYITAFKDFKTGKSDSSFNSSTAYSNQMDYNFLHKHQMIRSDFRNQEQLTLINQQKSLRTSSTLADMKNCSNTNNHKENIPSVNESDDENYQKQNKARGPVVLKYVENPVKRSQTKYKRSKNVATKVIRSTDF
jgi:hypothetical protein